jgi:transcriptional regulator with XRE-family HTH domain
MAEEVTGFSGLLRACRVAAGLSQEDLVRRSGLDVRTIRNLERGRARWPYPDTVSRLADALELRGPDQDAFTAAAGPTRTRYRGNRERRRPGRGRCPLVVGLLGLMSVIRVGVTVGWSRCGSGADGTGETQRSPW